jgi:MFS superfamily sulfate permease-like transporter
MTQFVPFVVTIVGILFTDLLTGIGLGMVVALFALLRAQYRNSHFLHEAPAEDGRPAFAMSLAEEVTFLKKGAIRRELDALPDGCIVTIDRSHTVIIDQDVEEVLEDFVASADRRSITVRTIERSAGDPHPRSQNLQPLAG